ncbi:accessory Sec system protein Asp2 [Fructilactobacillus myrtifloralis]|uniref:Accessory Sec system protein Asp2 n=1 Tax=Fructilactobacillus myrtifloralis TaxID=2940301 RepID=A0ABY5BNC2_9LACO|nr:accessory Sec system protein Asp2 [Fructilactobacillus myrtifloralis]USS84994.1 accessory Sec system protein Asp2 [Fructilactobacillus myrtifloralis]
MARPKFVTAVIHIGNADYTAAAQYLTDDYQYYHSDSVAPDQTPLPDQPLLKENGKLNPKYRNAVFILDAGFPWLDDPAVLSQLPANQILLTEQLELSPAASSILALKGAFVTDRQTPEELMKEIQHFFYFDPDGYRFDPRAWHFNWEALNSIQLRGNVYHDLELKPTDTWQLITAPHDSFFLPAKMADKVSLDYQIEDGAELGLKLTQTNAQTKQVIKTIFLTGDQLEHSLDVIGNEVPSFFQALLYGKGQGHVQVGDLHVRRSRGPYGEMMPNDVVLQDQALHGNVGIYFDAGDLKPPLNVYFAGYRTKEGYEGRRMMENFGAPFLLISDWRLEGGAFYLGDEEFEAQIVSIIQEKLHALDFKPSDLILAGMSMGTFGALYYGARLNPAGIVLGKPLAELGTIAQNGRVKRPNDFRTSEDMQLYFEPDLSDTSSHDLDQRFWKNLENGHLQNTTLAIAYMFQDDYNRDAYQGIRQRFVQLNPTGKLLAKGFEGRHNDQTLPIVTWFQRQYWYLLSQFGRKKPQKVKQAGMKQKKGA